MLHKVERKEWSWFAELWVFMAVFSDGDTDLPRYRARWSPTEGWLKNLKFVVVQAVRENGLLPRCSFWYSTTHVHRRLDRSGGWIGFSIVCRSNSAKYPVVICHSLCYPDYSADAVLEPECLKVVGYFWLALPHFAGNSLINYWKTGHHCTNAGNMRYNKRWTGRRPLSFVQLSAWACPCASHRRRLSLLLSTSPKSSKWALSQKKLLHERRSAEGGGSFLKFCSVRR